MADRSVDLIDQHDDGDNNQIDLSDNDENAFDFNQDMPSIEEDQPPKKSQLSTINEESRMNCESQALQETLPNLASQTSNVSLSMSRLAALDAKYAHLNQPIEKIDLNTVLSSIKSRRCQPLTTHPFQNQLMENRMPETQSIMNRTMDTQAVERLAFDNQSVRNQPSKSQSHATQSVKNQKLDAQSIRDRSTEKVLFKSQPIQDHDDLFGLSTQKNCYISADKNVLAFGFVDGETTHELSVNITNDSNEPIWLQPSIVHSEQSKPGLKLPGFRLKNTNSFLLDSKASRSVDVEFEPKAVKTYNGQLRLRLMSKDEPEFVIQMFGYGARAHLDVYTRNFENITMGADGIGVCDLDRSAKEVELVLANPGKRDAFAYIKAVNFSNQGLSNEIVTIIPNRVIVRKSTQEYAKIKIKFRHGASSVKASTHSTLHVSSNNSSHMTRATTLHNESLARLQIFWGEERQRMRLKEYLKQNPSESNSENVMQYVNKQFDGERESRTEKIVGSWDLSRFLGSVRLKTIQFVDTRVRPQSSASNTISRPPSATSINSGNVYQNQTLADTMMNVGNSQYSCAQTISETVDDDTLPLSRTRRY